MDEEKAQKIKRETAKGDESKDIKEEILRKCEKFQMDDFVHKFASRLKKFIAETGESYDVLSKKLEVSKATISNYVTGKRLPDVYFIFKIFHNYGKTPNELILGENLDLKFQKSREFELIPYIAQINLHRDSYRVEIGNPLTYYAFRAEWLKKLLTDLKNLFNKSEEIDVKTLFMYPVTDDEMEPTMSQHEVALVCSDLELRKNPDVHGIYLVKIQRAQVPYDFVFRRVTYKEIVKDGQHRVVLYFYGERLRNSLLVSESLEIDKEELPQYLIGRALWVGKQLI